jgi:methylated-DNA-[protein]-cysteine S-methyltransferase
VTATHIVVDSPLGELTVSAEDGSLTGLYFPHHWHPPTAGALGARGEEGFGAAGSGEVRRQLAEYFEGQRKEFGLPVLLRGDEFQRRVWALIAAIPYGDTVTYGELAAELTGQAQGGAVLAKDVGAAVGRNPLSVIVPCHRVVGKDGKLTGYAGGLKRKQFLLTLENPRRAEPATLF